MPKILLLSVFLCCAAFIARGQDHFTVKGDSLKRTPAKVDTGYVNLGKIAAHKAALRSAMVPGWGQIGSGLNIYRGLKVAAIYTGGVLLGMSFVQNTNNYHKYLAEIQYRTKYNDQSPPGSPYAGYSTSGLITAKEVYRRNREVVIFSFVGLYAINIIDAYVDSRLKYFDVDNNLSVKICPTLISTNMLAGSNSYAPALKIAFRL